MKRAVIILLLLIALGLVVGFSIRSWGTTYPQTRIASVDMQTGGDSATTPVGYVYYALKDARGFMLARAPKGVDGHPLSQPLPLTLLSNGFGLAESDSISSLQLSPDGRYMAVDGNSDHGDMVWIYNTQLMTVALEPANVMGNFLRWLPRGNGHTFLYRPMFPLGPDAPMDGNGANGWNPGLWLVDAESGTHKNIDIDVPSANLVDAAASPDGARIVYSTTAGLGMGSDIWLMNSDGGERVHLFGIDGGAQSVVGMFAWSPDGSRIAYERLSDSATPFLAAGLWVMDSRGGQQHRLSDADGGHGYALSWSPDGRKIAFVARTNLNDHRANVLAQSLRCAIGVAAVDEGRAWLVASPDATGGPLNIDPTWSPDSASIVFTALNPVNRVEGAAPRYWSARVVEPGMAPPARPQIVPLTPAFPHVVAIG